MAPGCWWTTTPTGFASVGSWLSIISTTSVPSAIAFSTSLVIIAVVLHRWGQGVGDPPCRGSARPARDAHVVLLVVGLVALVVADWPPCCLVWGGTVVVGVAVEVICQVRGGDPAHVLEVL